MKVLLVDQIYNVTYKFVDSLVNALKDKNIDVDVVDYFISGETNYSKLQKVKNYITSYRRICDAIETEKYDILHIQWFILSPIDYFFLSKIKKKYDIELIQTVHDIYPFKQYFFDKYFFDKCYRKCDWLVLQTKHAYDEFVTLFPDLKSRVSMIPHGDFNSYAHPIDKDKAREYLKIDKSKKVLLFYGQIKKVKGIKTAIYALNKIKDSVDNILFVIAGKDLDDSVSNYADYIKECGLDKYLKVVNSFIPDDEEKYYFSAADAVVLPYTEIYQSGVIQVAMAYKKTIFASNLEGFTEHITDGENGFIFETNNSNELADKVIAYFNNGKEQLDISYVTDKLNEELSWGKISESYSNIYRNCANN